MEEVEKVMDDEYFGESYDKEMALQEEYYEIGKEAGIKKGVKQGIKKEKIKIAKHLLENNIDIEIIEKSTGLNKEELIKLKDYSQSFFCRIKSNEINDMFCRKGIKNTNYVLYFYRGE